MALLTVSQRLAIGLCAALIAASLLWLMQWSTTPDMVPVFEHEFAYDKIAAAETALSTGHVAYQTRGRRIFVQARDRDSALRILYETETVPDEGGLDVETLIANANPFQPESDKEFARNVALGNRLAQIIATSDLVERASVVIEPTTKRRVGYKAEVPKASVTLFLASGKEMNPQMVRGFALMVSHAVAGLEPHFVAVIDGRTMRPYTLPGPGEADAFGFLDEVRKHEKHLQEKVALTLAYIPSVIANVSVELDNTRSKTERQVFEKPQPKSEDSKVSETSAAQTPSESGVNANLGMGLTAGGPGQSSTTEDSKTEFFEPNLRERTTEEKIAPARRRVTASILVPRSWIVSVYQYANPTAKNPTEDELKDVRSIELQKVGEAVAKAILADVSDVKVDTYHDLDVEGKPMAATYAAAFEPPAPDTLTLVKSYAPQIGLGSLALLSLIMLMRVVRRSSALLNVQEESPPQEEREPGEETDLYVAGGPVGRAALSSGFLEGQELSEDELRYQEINEQVSNLVENDPATAADLVKRWISESND